MVTVRIDQGQTYSGTDCSAAYKITRQSSRHLMPHQFPGTVILKIFLINFYFGAFGLLKLRQGQREYSIAELCLYLVFYDICRQGNRTAI